MKGRRISPWRRGAEVVVLLRSNAKFDRLENLLPLPLPETVRRQICLPVAVSASSESTDLSDVSATGDSESSVRHKNNSSLNCICGTINSIELKLNFFFQKKGDWRNLVFGWATGVTSIQFVRQHIDGDEGLVATGRAALAVHVDCNIAELLLFRRVPCCFHCVPI